jgi:hypothetical protein
VREAATASADIRGSAVPRPGWRLTLDRLAHDGTACTALIVLAAVVFLSFAASRANDRDGEGGSGMGEDPSVIRAEIEETRQRVGDAVDALSYKTDVGARTQDYIDDKKETVKTKLTGAKDTVTAPLPDRRAEAKRDGASRHGGTEPARTRDRWTRGRHPGRHAAATELRRERAAGRALRPHARCSQGNGSRSGRAWQAGRPGGGGRRRGQGQGVRA